MRFRLAVIAAVAVASVAAAPALAAGGPDPEIAALQVSLRSKGMYFGKIDGLAGPMTAKGLRAFQRAAGLPVTGELGPRTRAQLGALGRPLVARRVLVQGTYGWDVSSLQFLLARAGHLRLLDVDGHFGASTKAGLLRFQRTRGLAKDGIAGPATLTAFGHGRRTPVLTQATSVDDQLRRAAGGHAHRDRRQAQDDRPRARRRQRHRVGEPRRRGREAPPARRGRVGTRARAQPLDRPRAHRQVGGALRHLRQPRPRARVAGVRLPDERDLVDRRLGADADHAGHLDVRRNRPARADGAEDG